MPRYLCTSAWWEMGVHKVTSQPHFKMDTVTVIMYRASRTSHHSVQLRLLLLASAILLFLISLLRWVLRTQKLWPPRQLTESRPITRSLFHSWKGSEHSLTCLACCQECTLLYNCLLSSFVLCAEGKMRLFVFDLDRFTFTLIGG